MPFDNEAFQILMEALAQGKSPFLFHCATGKDRTGVAAMIILMALGIPEETILYDYLLSNDYHEAQIAKEMDEFSFDIAEHPELAELLMMKNGVTEKNGISVLDSIKAEYGTYSAYLKEEFSLYGSSLADFRDLYLE